MPALIAMAACSAVDVAQREHPLDGKIWDVRHERFVTQAEAEAIIANADYALLGETHDNPIHHRIQLRLLELAAQRAPKPALAMEQIDRDTGKTPPGWHWSFYEPLVAFAKEHGLRVIPANLSRAGTGPVLAQGLDALQPGEARRLAIEEVWSPERNAKLRALIVEGHCGQDDPIIDKVVTVQRVRDAMMADAILEAPRAVAILGRGHAREDVGVPLYLARRAPGKNIISLGLVEVERGSDSPQDYPDAAPGTHDLVWFTPATERKDPCASFKPIRR